MVFMFVVIIMGVMCIVGMFIMHAMCCDWCMVSMLMLVYLAEAFFAMEHHEIHAERIESSHKHAGQHGEVGKAGTRQVRCRCRINDAVFGIEPGEKWCSDQRQRTQQRSNPGNRHVLAQTTHVAHVLIMMHA